MLWNKSGIDINNLTTYESTVSEIGLTEIKIGRGNSTSEIVYLKMDGLTDVLGINYLDDGSQDYILNKVKKGDKVKVMFNQSGQKVPEGLNLHTYQLESKGEIFVASKDMTSRDNTFAKIMFGLGALFMIWPYLLYRYLRKKNMKQSST